MEYNLNIITDKEQNIMVAIPLCCSGGGGGTTVNDTKYLETSDDIDLNNPEYQLYKKFYLVITEATSKSVNVKLPDNIVIGTNISVVNNSNFVSNLTGKINDGDYNLIRKSNINIYTDTTATEYVVKE